MRKRYTESLCNQTNSQLRLQYDGDLSTLELWWAAWEVSRMHSKLHDYNFFPHAFVWWLNTQNRNSCLTHH